MDIVQKLIDLGIREGGPADILLSSKQQFKLINDFEISLEAHKNTQYKCVVVPNNGHQVFSSPVMGPSANPIMGGTSLQVGVFTLLQFKKLIPLLPVFNDSRPDRLAIGLYSISEEFFDLEALVRLYKVERVHADFTKMQDAHKVSELAFLDEFERKKAITRKAQSNRTDSDANSGSSEPNILVEEVHDEELLRQITSTLELQKLQYKDNQNIDPWAGSTEVDSLNKTNTKFK